MLKSNYMEEKMEEEKKEQPEDQIVEQPEETMEEKPEEKAEEKKTKKKKEKTEEKVEEKPAVEKEEKKEEKTTTTKTVTRVESKFTGGAFANFFIEFLTDFVSICTLGLLYPLMLCWHKEWEVSHTYINGRQLMFDGKALQLFGKYLWWLFLSVINSTWTFWTQNTFIFVEDSHYWNSFCRMHDGRLVCKTQSD